MHKLCLVPLSSIHQRGSTVLTLLILLISGIVMSAGWVYQHILFAQRAAHNNAMKSQSMAAAETGLSWAQTHLNSIHTLGHSSCQLRPGSQVPKGQAGHSLACQHHDSAWHCQCGNNLSLENLPTPAAGPAFVVDLLPSSMERSVQVRSRACAQASPACGHQPGAELHQTWSLMGGLHRLPSAALMALGSVQISGFSELIDQKKMSPAFSKQTITGSPVDHQPGFIRPLNEPPEKNASPSVKQSSELFKSMFGFDKHEWQTQPSLLRLQCEHNCSQSLAEHLADESVTMVHLRELRVDSPITLGSPHRPVLFIVDELAQLNGPITLYGVLYAGRITSQAPEATLQIHGALISETDITLGHRPRVNFDPVLLQKLQNSTGSYVRVPATWIDS